MYLDGAGLYLQVKDTGRSWIYRFKSPTRGKSREMGLGPTHTIGLAKARELRNQSAGLVASGIDPIDGFIAIGDTLHDVMGGRHGLTGSV